MLLIRIVNSLAANMLLLLPVTTSRCCSSTATAVRGNTRVNTGTGWAADIYPTSMLILQQFNFPSYLLSYSVNRQTYHAVGRNILGVDSGVLGVTITAPLMAGTCSRPAEKHKLAIVRSRAQNKTLRACLQPQTDHQRHISSNGSYRKMNRAVCHVSQGGHEAACIQWLALQPCLNVLTSINQVRTAIKQ